MDFSLRALWPGGFAAAMALWAGAGAAAAEAGATAVTCTNPASGYTWQIEIDYAKSTVDSHPARISASAISWHDDKDGNSYTLDRESGKLTQVFASATGGNMLFHRCAVKN